MAIAIEKAACSGCRVCANACPQKCIAMEPDAEGFWYPAVDASRCVECGLCERVCPVLHSAAEPADRTPKAYAAWCEEEDVRMNSSSGGLFSLLAEDVLAQGGVVFGAALTEDCREVRHIAVESAGELYKLRGSKYLQSNTMDAYQCAKDHLQAGRKVLFSGTPCQVEGLRSYLPKDYENLLCVDIVCHGVPSPRVWERYVSFREEKAGAPAREVSFRHKKSGWKAFSMRFEHENGVVYEKTLGEDPFMQAFLRNASLRPSCAQCSFKKKNRVSDLTLADFWGVGRVVPQMDDDRGTSLVLVHSSRGEQAFRELWERLRVKEVDVDKALAYNPAALFPVTAHAKRGEFFANLEDLPFDQLVGCYADQTVSLRARVAHLLKRLRLDAVVRFLRGRT